MMGTGVGSGPERGRLAAEKAVESKLLEDISLKDAKGVLVNITAGTEITLGEIRAVGDCIERFADKDALIVTGAVIDKSIGNDIVVTVIATGLGTANNTAIVEVPRLLPREINERDPLPLSEAARRLLENPSSTESDPAHDNKEEKENDNFLDIPSFVRSQLD
jgi:cell division protein FtsZ